MKVIKKIAIFIFMPISFFFNVGVSEQISKACRRKPYIIILTSVGITLLVVALYYIFLAVGN